MKCVDSVRGEYEMEHWKISIEGEPEIWFRRNPNEGDWTAEVMTNHPEVQEELVAIAEKFPEEIEILSLIEDGGFHAIIQPSISFELQPCGGLINISAIIG